MYLKEVTETVQEESRVRDKLVRPGKNTNGHFILFLKVILAVMHSSDVYMICRSLLQPLTKITTKKMKVYCSIIRGDENP
ncbi:MAG: hypothetical protein Q4C96_07030 [Planctomycetia bacterium]|nr:hypothetical protein [Planctomycetia bacterium]